MIAPIMIACKKRYAKCAKIAVETFLEHHDTKLYVVVDAPAQKALSKIKSDNLIIVPLAKYREKAIRDVNVKEFTVFKYDDDGDHDRAYSSLKPLIMDKVIADLVPKADYILSLDADTIFSGNILDRIVLQLRKFKHKPQLYLVKRSDPRMLCFKNGAPGSGFTLWRRDGNFIKFFKKSYRAAHAGFRGGGSQSIIQTARSRLKGKMLTDPLLHFVSPDLKNPKLTDKEILTFKPAYIHLHGEDSFKRLTRFRKVFEAGRK